MNLIENPKMAFTGITDKHRGSLYRCQNCGAERWTVYGQARIHKCTTIDQIREYNVERSHEYKQRWRLKLLEYFGDKCFLCEFILDLKGKNFAYHEIQGEKHKNLNPKQLYEDRKKFVLLCNPCHHLTHLLMEYYSKSWSEIRNFLSDSPTLEKPILISYRKRV